MNSRAHNPVTCTVLLLCCDSFKSVILLIVLILFLLFSYLNVFHSTRVLTLHSIVVDYVAHPSKFPMLSVYTLHFLETKKDKTKGIHSSVATMMFNSPFLRCF